MAPDAKIVVSVVLGLIIFGVGVGLLDAAGYTTITRPLKRGYGG